MPEQSVSGAVPDRKKALITRALASRSLACVVQTNTRAHRAVVSENSAEGLAGALVQKVFKVRQAGRPAEAADLMEEAFNKSPELRQKYSHQVKFWRRGISM